MNRYIGKLLSAVLLACLFVACEQDEVELYGEKAYLVFEMPTSGNDNTPRDSLILSFPLKGDDCTEDTLWFKMRVIGRSAPFDREITFKINESGTTAKTENYKLEPCHIPADSFKVDVPLVVYRAGLKDTIVRLELDIEPNEYFGIGFSEVSKGIFLWGDTMIMPDNWYTGFDSYYRYFGEYTETRYVFILQSLGFDELPSLGNYLTFKEYNRKVRAALYEYNQNHDEPLSDELGPVSFPDNV